MLSKQLTSRLKEEQERERESQQNSNTTHLSTSQCDRLIRTVSCKVINIYFFNFSGFNLF